MLHNFISKMTKVAVLVSWNVIRCSGFKNSSFETETKIETEMWSYTIQAENGLQQPTISPLFRSGSSPDYCRWKDGEITMIFALGTPYLP